MFRHYSGGLLNTVMKKNQTSPKHTHAHTIGSVFVSSAVEIGGNVMLKRMIIVYDFGLFSSMNVTC